MCNFGDCAVGNNHLKAFYEQVGWHRRFQCVFQLRVWTIERLHSVFVSVTCQWNSNMYSFNTAPQYWLSTCALTHTHTHIHNDSMSYWSPSLRQSCHCSSTSTVVFCTLLWEFPVTPRKMTGFLSGFQLSTLHTHCLLSSDNSSKKTATVSDWVLFA